MPPPRRAFGCRVWNGASVVPAKGDQHERSFRSVKTYGRCRRPRSRGTRDLFPKQRPPPTHPPLFTQRRARARLALPPWNTSLPARETSRHGTASTVPVPSALPAAPPPPRYPFGPTHLIHLPHREDVGAQEKGRRKCHGREGALHGGALVTLSGTTSGLAPAQALALGMRRR